MFFLVELSLWLAMPIMIGWACGVLRGLGLALRGLGIPARNRQMSRLQFLTQLSLIGLPVLYFAAAMLGAWFGERRLGLVPLLGVAACAVSAAWCGQRLEQMAKQIQSDTHESFEPKRLRQ